MRAAVWYGARDVRVETRARLALPADHIRIAVTYCAICGSDLNEYASGPHAIPIYAPHPVSRVQAPIILGHEFCGRVLEAGDDVHDFVQGQRVVIEPEYRCMRCDACRRGDYNLCQHTGFAGLTGHGGMADEAVVPAYMVHALPDSVSDEQAAVIEPAAGCLHALRRGRLSAGETCLIAGAGPMGLLLVQLAKVAGAREIIVSDVTPKRLALAGELGATRAVDVTKESLGEAAAEATDGRGVDIAFETVGLQSSLDEALMGLRKGGRLVLVGQFDTHPRIDAAALVGREIDVISAVGYRNIYPDLIAMVADRLFDPSRIVTAKTDLSRVVEMGFERLLDPKGGAVKILVSPNG